MDSFPAVTSKKLTDCQPGELVLLPVGRNGTLSLALVASAAGSRGHRRYVVVMTGGDDFRAEAAGSGTLPRYIQPDFDRYRTVLSFGHDYAIEADPHGPVTLGSGGLWYRTGALALHGGDWFLRVHPAGGGDLESLFFSLPGGIAPDEEPTDTVVFGRWAIYPQGAGPRDLGERARPLASFKVAPE